MKDQKSSGKPFLVSDLGLSSKAVVKNNPFSLMGTENTHLRRKLTSVRKRESKKERALQSHRKRATQ